MLVGLVHEKYSPLRDEQDGLEFELTFNREMLHGKVVFPVVRQALVEGTVLFLSDLVGVASPDGLCLVELLVLDSLLLDRLLLLTLLFLLVFVDLLDLRFLLVLFFLLFFFVFDLLKIIVRLRIELHTRLFIAYLLNLLRNGELDRVRNELGVLLHDVLDPLLLKVLKLIFLEVKANLGTTAERRVDGVSGDGEGTTSGRLPDVLLIIVVFGDDLHALGDKVCRIETDTELPNHRNIRTSA